MNNLIVINERLSNNVTQMTKSINILNFCSKQKRSTHSIFLHKGCRFYREWQKSLHFFMIEIIIRLIYRMSIDM